MGLGSGLGFGFGLGLGIARDLCEAEGRERGGEAQRALAQRRRRLLIAVGAAEVGLEQR